MDKTAAELRAEILEMRHQYDNLKHDDRRRGQLYEVIDFREGELQKLSPSAFRQLRRELGMAV